MCNGKGDGDRFLLLPGSHLAYFCQFGRCLLASPARLNIFPCCFSNAALSLGGSQTDPSLLGVRAALADRRQAEELRDFLLCQGWEMSREQKEAPALRCEHLWVPGVGLEQLFEFISRLCCPLVLHFGGDISME